MREVVVAISLYLFKLTTEMPRYKREKQIHVNKKDLKLAIKGKDLKDHSHCWMINKTFPDVLTCISLHNIHHVAKPQIVKWIKENKIYIIKNNENITSKR